MSDVYEDDPKFRVKLLACMLQNSWFTRYGIHIIKPEYFPLDSERDVAKALVTYFQDHKKTCPDATDLLHLVGPEYSKLVHAVFASQDLALAEKHAVVWAKMQAAKIAVLDSVADVKAGNLEAVLERVQKASQIGENLESVGLDFKGDVDIWLSEEELYDKIQTGWLHVDKLLDGGIGRGELFVVMAPSNRGKSMALANIAYGAAGLGSGKNVAIFSHEMSSEKYAKRLSARMVHRFPTRFGLDDYKQEFMDKAKRLMPGNIRIIGGGKQTLAQIETQIRNMCAEGFIPDLVIDDYPDLIISDRRNMERRNQLTDVYERLRQFGIPGELTKEGFAVACATQSTRGSYNKEIITLEDVAEDIGKVHTADIVVALCQTSEEAQDEVCRLFGAKVRDAEAGFMVNAKYLRKSQAIITTSITKKKPVRSL